MLSRYLFTVALVAFLLLSSIQSIHACCKIDNNMEEKKSEANESTNNEKKREAATPGTEEQIILLNEKVRKLEEIVERQQRIIEKIEPRETTSKTAAETEKSTANPVAITPVDEQAKKVDSLYKAFGKFSISGDLRFRSESITNQGFDNPLETPDRNRFRARARIQFAGQIGKNFDYGIRLASGSFTNPISSNQTVTDFFNRKPIGLDRYFIRYDSKTEHAGIILQAGKFDYPWKRTELTFDNDLQPEGAAETIYFKGKSVFKELRLVAFQLPFNESNNGKDSVLYGGQLSGTVGTGNWIGTGGAAFYNFNQVDAIARALNRPATQVGGLEFGTSNRVRRDQNGNIIGFLANYNILDLITEISYNGFKNYPVLVVLNYARNLSNRLDRLKERNAYWTEIKVGRLKEKGDFELGYTFMHLEQDSVLSVFNFSEILLSTNSRVSRISAAYMVNNNIFFQLTGLFPQKINTTGRENRTARIFQFDINYKF